MPDVLVLYFAVPEDAKVAAFVDSGEANEWIVPDGHRFWIVEDTGSLLAADADGKKLSNLELVGLYNAFRRELDPVVARFESRVVGAARVARLLLAIYGDEDEDTAAIRDASADVVEANPPPTFVDYRELQPTRSFVEPVLPATTVAEPAAPKVAAPSKKERVKVTATELKPVREGTVLAGIVRALEKGSTLMEIAGGIESVMRYPAEKQAQSAHWYLRYSMARDHGIAFRSEGEGAEARFFLDMPGKTLADLITTPETKPASKTAEQRAEEKAAREKAAAEEKAKREAEKVAAAAKKAEEKAAKAAEREAAKAKKAAEKAEAEAAKARAIAEAAQNQPPAGDANSGVFEG